MANELDEFLGGGKRASGGTAPAGKAAYEAFKAVDRRQLRLLVCPRLRAWEALPYTRLDRIVMDGVYGTRLALIWGFAVVVVRGRNLQELGRALMTERCATLQEFDSDRFDRPDDRAAMIDSIEIHVESREEMVQAAAEAAGGRQN